MPSNGTTPEDKNTDGHQVMPVDVRLFAVSRAMKAEAEAVFYHSNIFEVYTNEPLPLFIRQAAAAGDGEASQHPVLGLRRIHIHFPFHKPRSNGDHNEHVQRVAYQELLEHTETIAKALVKCRKLEQIRFTGRSCNRPQCRKQDLGEDFPRLVGLFGEVRGVGEVVFERIMRITDPFGEIAELSCGEHFAELKKSMESAK